MNTKILITGSSGFLGSRLAAELMGLNAPTEWILPDEERFCEEPRNLTMDCSMIEANGILFKDSVEGIEEAIKRPFRTE